MSACRSPSPVGTVRCSEEPGGHGFRNVTGDSVGRGAPGGGKHLNRQQSRRPMLRRSAAQEWVFNLGFFFECLHSSKRPSDAADAEVVNAFREKRTAAAHLVPPANLPGGSFVTNMT